MKKSTLLLLSLSLFFSLPTYSQYSASTTVGSEPTDQTATYLKNLATYFGYDVENAADPYASILLKYTSDVASMGHQILNAFFAARPVNPNYSTFTTNSIYQSFNNQANILFKDSFNTATNNKTTGISVVPNFDQKDYRKDPTEQAIANILINPNTTTCTDSNSADAPCVSQSKVMGTVLQDIMDENNYLPGEGVYFSPNIVDVYSNQLNFNTMLAPLLYSTSGEQSTKGLPAANQEQQAMNFIRYVTSAVLPVDSMSQTDYSTMWTNAHTEITDGMSPDQINTIKTARKDLMTYLLRTRVYAAQSSLPISNFYQSMEQRMPQSGSANSGTQNSGTQTSQAFNEFVMATWRLYSPGAQDGEQWVDQINKASAATTQKEIAILLSEINYQLYLSRQTQERILLTNSLLALQSLANNQPNNTTTSVSVSGGSGSEAPTS
jgi:intracellular multiplication protein IcmX